MHRVPGRSHSTTQPCRLNVTGAATATNVLAPRPGPVPIGPLTYSELEKANKPSPNSERRSRLARPIEDEN
jgi:hypothetical protein